MKTLTDKTIYRCEFCKKYYLSKRFAIQHETRCQKNPTNFRPCFSCPHLKDENTEIYLDQYNGCQAEITVKVLFCELKKIYLIPPKAIHKGHGYDLGDNLNEPMPIECNEFNLELNKAIPDKEFAKLDFPF